MVIEILLDIKGNLLDLNATIDVKETATSVILNHNLEIRNGFSVIRKEKYRRFPNSTPVPNKTPCPNPDQPKIK